MAHYFFGVVDVLITIFGIEVEVTGWIGNVCALCGILCTTCPRPCVNAKSKKPRYSETMMEIAMTRIV